MEALPEPWLDELARIWAVVEEGGIWPEGLLDAYVALTPKVGGDATSLGQHDLKSVCVEILVCFCALRRSLRWCCFWIAGWASGL